MAPCTPVRATSPHGVEAGDGRLPVEIRHDAAHLVVGGRRDGHAAREQVGAGLAQTGDDVGEAARDRGRGRGPRSRGRRCAALELRVDGAGHDVARGQVALRVDALHDATAVPGDQGRALAAQRLGQQEAVARRAGRERGRVELHELHVGHPGAGAVGQGDAVSGGAGRVGGAGPERAGAPGREDRGPGAQLEDLVAVQGERAAARLAVGDQPEHRRPLQHRDARIGEHAAISGSAMRRPDPRRRRAGRDAGCAAPSRPSAVSPVSSVSKTMP